MKKKREDGIKYFNQENYTEALDIFLSEDIDPEDDPELSYYLGLTYSRLEDFPSAERYLKLVIDNDINMARLYQSRLLLGYLYNKTGHFSSAEYHMNKLVDEGYQSAQIFANLGYATWNQGLVDESLDYYEKGLALAPDNPNILNAAGYIMGDRGRNLNRALEMCQKAVSKNPMNGNYLDSLGWIYFKIGNKEQAELFLRKALEYSGESIIQKHYEMVKRR